MASLPNRMYNSSDGKAKTTIEDVFRSIEDDSKAALTKKKRQAPWEFGFQMNERNVRWIDELKVALIKRIAAEEMELDDAEFEQRLSTLVNVLPGVDARIAKMPPKLIVQLMANSHTISERLLALKSIFPQADVANLASSKPSLLLNESMEEIGSSADRLRELLPNSNVDLLVEKYPMLLNVASFEEAIRDAQRLMPSCDFEITMQTNPSLILSLQKGKDMIPYDEVPNCPP